MKSLVPLPCTILCTLRCPSFSFFFFNDTATTEIYTLSLHDALPILWATFSPLPDLVREPSAADGSARYRDRKSTRLNSSHDQISYAVFCLKKKKTPACSVLAPTRLAPLVRTQRSCLLGIRGLSTELP